MDLFGVRWHKVGRSDVRCRELADRHYSRQTEGAREFMGPGRVCVLFAEFSQQERAVWGAIDNLDPVGTRRFRCAIFRNETPWLSSDLVREATLITQRRWIRRFSWTGEPALTTEVDPSRTRKKRDPGRCFLRAGWVVVGETGRGLVVLRAPSLDGI